MDNNNKNISLLVGQAVEIIPLKELLENGYKHNHLNLITSKIYSDYDRYHLVPKLFQPRTLKYPVIVLSIKEKAGKEKRAKVVTVRFFNDGWYEKTISSEFIKPSTPIQVPFKIVKLIEDLKNKNWKSYFVETKVNKPEFQLHSINNISMKANFDKQNTFLPVILDWKEQRFGISIPWHNETRLNLTIGQAKKLFYKNNYFEKELFTDGTEKITTIYFNF